MKFLNFKRKLDGKLRVKLHVQMSKGLRHNLPISTFAIKVYAKSRATYSKKHFVKLSVHTSDSRLKTPNLLSNILNTTNLGLNYLNIFTL